jgi:hypothetical protein
MWKWYWIVTGIIIALPLVIPFVTKWLVAPILLRFKQKIPAHLQFQHVTPDALTREARQSLDLLIPQFVAEGFEYRGTFSHVGEAMPAAGVEVLLAHSSTGDVAALIASWASGIRSLSMAVKSEFTDGAVIESSATRFIGYHPKHPGVDYVCFSWVTDAHTLCEVHRRRVARRGKSADARVMLPPGTEIEYIRQESDDENGRMMRLGYHYFDPADDTYRLTWKGAFLAAWRISEPLRTRRRNRRDRKARVQWRELGMEEWKPPISPSPPQQPISPTPPPLPQAYAPVTPDLSYEVALPEDHWRREVIHGGITVYAGNPTVGRFLARHWWALTFIGFSLALFAVYGVLWWRHYMLSLRVPGFRLRKPTTTPLLIVGAIAAFDVLKIVLGLRRLGTPTSVTATDAGLTFRNAPALRRFGHIAREDLNGLHVAIEQFGLRNRRYQLAAFVAGGRRHKLFVARDKESLELVKNDLLTAMGIELPEPSPAADEPPNP